MPNDELQRRPECSNDEKLTEIFHHSDFVILSSFVIFHNAAGEKDRQSCVAKCIRRGGPVGIVSEGKASLVVGEHQRINDQLADLCGKNVTLNGKLAKRGGIATIENAEVVKK